MQPGHTLVGSLASEGQGSAQSIPRSFQGSRVLAGLQRSPKIWVNQPRVGHIGKIADKLWLSFWHRNYSLIVPEYFKHKGPKMCVALVQRTCP